MSQAELTADELGKAIRERELKRWRIIKYIPGLNVIWGAARFIIQARRRNAHQALSCLPVIAGGILGIVVSAVICAPFWAGFSAIESAFWAKFMTFVFDTMVGMLVQTVVIGIGDLLLTLAFAPEEFDDLTSDKVEEAVFECFIKHIPFIGAIYTLPRAFVFLSKGMMRPFIVNLVTFVIMIVLQVVVCVIAALASHNRVCNVDV